MGNGQPNQATVIELLKHLLDEQLRLRSDMARELHTKKSGLLVAGLALYAMQKKDSAGKFTAELNDIKNTLNTFINEIAPLNAAIYPTVVNIMGLQNALALFVDQSLQNQGAKIYYTCFAGKLPNVEKIKEVVIYQLITETAEYLYLSACTNIGIHLELRKKTLMVEVTANPATKKTKPNKALAQKLVLIKALLAWQGLTALAPATNWTDTFVFNIALGVK